MPIWGLKTVAQVIATGFEGPQHCDEPWPYHFAPAQQVLVHVRGEGRSSVWLPGRIIKPTYAKQYPTTTLQYYRLEYLESGILKRGDFSPQDGDVKPDCPYVRELIAEELMWPIDEPDRSIPPMRAGGAGAVPNQMRGRTRVAC
ncbi:hypothetical protein SCHPADRAFT_914072 [Schizopora paradoxa]|uniref:Uncharacterized protein n=1 Tax=Schizopora paradoxa TaxID=27342 RepID=A0A0H2RWR6_9AGAM|nr:hypothetical protein SCHPADRAFT_914072 [Schizopora paradoxa]